MFYPLFNITTTINNEYKVLKYNEYIRKQSKQNLFNFNVKTKNK